MSFFGVVAGLPTAAFRAAVVECRDGKQVRPITTSEKGRNVMGRFQELDPSCVGQGVHRKCLNDYLERSRWCGLGRVSPPDSNPPSKTND